MTEPKEGFDYDLGLRHCVLKFVTMKMLFNIASKTPQMYYTYITRFYICNKENPNKEHYHISFNIHMYLENFTLTDLWKECNELFAIYE